MKQSMILLHGLFGGLSNWTKVIAEFEHEYDIHAPALPLYDEHQGNIIDYLVNDLKCYIDHAGLGKIILIGNSLGGHVAILYTHRHPEKVSKLVLTGSSGLYENYMIGSFPRRRDRNYIKRQVENVFYSPEVATTELIDGIMETLADRQKCFKIVNAAKTTQRNYVTDILPLIQKPVLLIWGANDNITPPAVAEQFKRLLPLASLIYLSDCGHAAMMECPHQFNETLQVFLDIKI